MSAPAENPAPITPETSRGPQPERGRGLSEFGRRAREARTALGVGHVKEAFGILAGRQDQGQQQAPEHEHKPEDRLQKGFDAIVNATCSSFEVNRAEILQSLLRDPDAKGFLVEASHIGDTEMAMVTKAVLDAIRGTGRKVLIADMSTHRDSEVARRTLDPTKLGIDWMGVENFIDVSFIDKKGGRMGFIDPRNIAAVEKALKDRNIVIMAAHKPTASGHDTLPERGGYLGPIAALGADVPIVPAAAQLGEGSDVLGRGGPGMLRTLYKRIIGQAPGRVTFGNPISLPRDEAILAAVSEIKREVRVPSQDSSESDNPQPARRPNLRQVMDQLTAPIMRSLGAMLPERAGIWAPQTATPSSPATPSAGV